MPRSVSLSPAKMKVSVTILALLTLVAAGPLAAGADTTATVPGKDQIMSAFDSMDAADQARQKKAYDEAMKLYGKALDAYMLLARDYPQWQTNLVRFRVEYCRDQLKVLLGLVGNTRASSPAGTTPVPPMAIAPVPSTPATNAGPASPLTFRPPSTNTVAPVDLADPPPGDSLQQITAKAKVLLSEGKFVKARALLMEGIGIDPDHYLVRLLLGVAQCEAGRFDDALLVLKTLAEENPSDPHIHIALAGAHLGLGDSGEAKKEVAAAIKLKPKMPAAHYNMVQVLLATNPPDIELARHRYRKALEFGARPDEAVEALLAPQEVPEEIRAKD